MSATKGDLALAALEEIGIASYEFDIDSDQISSAISRLNGLMAEWAARGVLITFPVQGLEATLETNIPDWAMEAVTLALAIRLAPQYGKTPSPETKVAAKEAQNTVFGVFARPKRSQFNSMPKGAGYKPTSYPFTPAPESQYLEPIDNSFNPSGGFTDE